MGYNILWTKRLVEGMRRLLFINDKFKVVSNVREMPFRVKNFSRANLRTLISLKHVFKTIIPTLVGFLQNDVTKIASRCIQKPV